MVVLICGCATAGASSSSVGLAADGPAGEPAREREREPEREPEPQPEPQPASGEAASMPVDAAVQAPADEASTVAPPMVVETITGIPDCDAYLDLYARCVDFLRPQIMAGDRRFYATEKASLLYFAESPEAPALPGSCAGMLDELRKDCPEEHRVAARGG